VYKAKLVPALGGIEVAVKVQRPGVLEQVALDLHVMRELALYLQTFPEVSLLL
jgi:aarF domain-containing kinase